MQCICDARWRPAAVLGLLAAVVLAASMYLGRQYPAPTVRWDHVVWGYIKMGKNPEAQVVAQRVAPEQPDNAAVIEALGYLAATAQHFEAAVREYQRAIQLRPRSYLAHYNLAKAYLALGQRAEALIEAQVALTFSPSAEARALLLQAAAAP